MNSGGALDFAREAADALRASGHQTLIVDCNAIAPDTVHEIAGLVTPPSRPTPPPVQAAAPPPPQATPPPPPQETREQWRQQLFDEMRSYCNGWLTDTACGPNALSGGSGTEAR